MSAVNMDGWLSVCAVAELTPGKRKVVAGLDEDILVVNADGVIYAVVNLCTHQTYELDDGLLEGDRLTCIHHGAEFCLKTGEALTPPAYEPLACYDVLVQDEQIYVARTARG